MSSLQIVGVATVAGFALFCCLVSLIGNRQLSKDKAEVQTALFNHQGSIVQEQPQDEADQVLVGT